MLAAAVHKEELVDHLHGLGAQVNVRGPAQADVQRHDGPERD
jgi:hypothetical protein